MADPAHSPNAGVTQQADDNQLQLSLSGTASTGDSFVVPNQPDVTWVMSPSTPRSQYAMALTPAGVPVNPGILVGYTCVCPKCGDNVQEPFIFECAYLNPSFDYQFTDRFYSNEF